MWKREPPRHKLILVQGGENLTWSDGDCFAATCSRHAYVFDTMAKNLEIETHPSTVTAIAWSDKNELATASYGQVAFYDIDIHSYCKSFNGKDL